MEKKQWGEPRLETLPIKMTTKFHDKPGGGKGNGSGGWSGSRGKGDSDGSQGFCS